MVLLLYFLNIKRVLKVIKEVNSISGDILRMEILGSFIDLVKSERCRILIEKFIERKF